MDMPNRSRTRIVVLAIIIVLIASLHYLTPTEPHSYHMLHIILRKFYLLPPVMAAGWFGLRGGCIAASAVSLLFILHAFLDWPGNYMEQANQIGELAGFWVAGVIPGWLFDRHKALLKDLADANEETLLALVSALDLREHNTRMHSQRVRDYTDLIAWRSGIPEKYRREIGFGALLHDVGKIAVPDRILLKADKLTEEEWLEMRKHPETGYRIVKRIKFLKDAADIVHSHHEHYDGSGYPRGLKGDEIPLGAKLFMVADVYDALTSERPYRFPMPYEEAVAEIRAMAGSVFDPAAVDAFLSIPPANLHAIAQQYHNGEPLA
jgi:putative nucleotidyltransferase with HDIG domain